MKLRRANSVEAGALVALIAARQSETRYAGKVEIDEPYARKLFAQAIHRHGGTNDGATFVMVAEDDAGAIEAVVMASLGRVYGIGAMLAASDNYLVGRKGCNPRALDALFDAYVEWAASNPKVFEIGGTWSNAFPGAERMGAYLHRKGFDRCGEIFRRENAITAQDKAA